MVGFRFSLMATLAGWLVSAAPCLAAGESSPIEGTLLVGDGTYKLTQVVAFETTSDDEPTITVVASDRRIPVETIKAALREGDGSDEKVSLSQPHVVVVLRKSGEAIRCKAWANNSAFSLGGDK